MLLGVEKIEELMCKPYKSSTVAASMETPLTRHTI